MNRAKVRNVRHGAGGWSDVAATMRTQRLSLPLRLSIPSLLVTAYPKNAIGFSFEGGTTGKALGAALLGASLALGALLYPVAGVLGVGLSFWLLGTAGAAMLVSSMKPFAFVKPLCSRCRLLPVIQEHEAIHLSGVESDDDVWRSMRSRYSCESLSLDGDPNVCWFCPIPRRLKEH